MQEEKEEKPKKLFVVTHIVYDDGEIDTEMSEYRKNPSGRGAPGKWRLGPKDFKRRIEETLGDADQIGEIMEEHLALTTEQDGIAVTALKPPRGHVPDKKELAELEAGTETLVDPDADEPKIDPDADKFDFGEFEEGK